MDFYDIYDENGNSIVYEIEFSNGTKIKNIHLNGNNWLSQMELTKGVVFYGLLRNV